MNTLRKHIAGCSVRCGMAAALVAGLASCAADDTARVEQALAEGKIVFTTSQVTAPVTRAAQPQDADPLLLTGYQKPLWLLTDVSRTEGLSPMGNPTRGTQLNSESVLTDFGVSAYKTAKTKGNLEGCTPDYFYNLQAVRAGETTDYTLTQDYYWPSNDERLWFYAYYPYNGSNSVENGDNLNVHLSAATLTGPQTIDFTVAPNAKDQVDLMTARTEQTDDFLAQAAPRVPLAFEHQLTGVRFNIGSQFPAQGYIQKIKLNNVYKHGVYTIGNGWTHADGDQGDFAVSYDDDTKVNSVVGQTVNYGDDVFLMIPATFTAEDNASVEITFWDGYDTHTVSTSLTGTTWAPGQTVTYSLSSEKLTTLKIQSLTYPATVAGAPYTGWNNGDEVGLYVVADGQKDGKELRYKNVKCTYQDGKWTIAKATVKDATTGKDVQVTPIMYPDDNYYFYYPYAEGEPVGKPSAANETDASAEAFWASVIAQHTVQRDQTQPADFKASDLQIAKAVVPSAEGSNLPASTIKATMLRQVGLAVLSLGTDQANKSVTFTNGVAGTPTKANVTATDKFLSTGNIPQLNGSKYYLYTLPGVETAISSDPTEKDAWENSLRYTLTAGTSQELTAHSDRHNWEYVDAVWNYTTPDSYSWTSASQGTYTYTLEVWGAQGGNATISNTSNYAIGGKGGYSTGSYSTSGGETLNVVVGGAGVSMSTFGVNVYATGGYNGGGYAYGNIDTTWGSGGGATHISTASGLLKDLVDDKTSVLLVAAGGGGAGACGEQRNNGGAGGGLTGIAGAGTQVGGGGGQSSAGIQADGAYEVNPGGFGFGGSSCVLNNNTTYPTTYHDNPTYGSGSGGGGGYYGGGGGYGTGSAGGGGSSYIGGVADGSTTAGNASFPAPGGGTETGHSGNGYARITLSRW